jgi:hypothetical protein
VQQIHRQTGDNAMARDKRGHIPEPTIDDGLDEMTEQDAGGTFVAGPTSRNEVGNTKRAAAKAIGNMGASKKIDPDLKMDGIDGGRPKSGSKAAIHSFSEVDPHDGAAEFRSTRSNAEIAEEAVTTARKSPARRPARATASGITTPDEGDRNGRRRVPAPGNVVAVPKGRLVRGKATASQAGGKSTSSTGETKPPKRSARAGKAQAKRPVSKGGSEERS